MNFLSDTSMNQALAYGIEHREHIHITRRNNEDWQLYKSYIKSGSSPDSLTIGDQCLTYGQEGDSSGEVGISFRQKQHKLLFHTILHNNVLTWPTQILKISRRAYQRQCPQENIPIRFWRQKNQSLIYHAQLKDISTGGMQISAITRDYDIGAYSCSINHSIFINAILRQAKPSDGITTLGFQFVGLEFDTQTTTKLIKLTNAMAAMYPLPKRSRFCVA